MEHIDFVEPKRKVPKGNKSTDFSRDPSFGKTAGKIIGILVRRLDRADAGRNRNLLPDDPAILYESCVDVVLRLAVLLCAERLELSFHNDSGFGAARSVLSLHEKLRNDAVRFGEERLELSFDAWRGLLDLFRTVHGMPFDLERFPFLEGREKKSSPPTKKHSLLPIDDRTVLHLLALLDVPDQSTEIEQIGRVYESLLDYKIERIAEPISGLKESPVPYDKGSFVVVKSSKRRENGTHYTPRSLSEEVVRIALEPHVYDGLSDGIPIERCPLKKSDEILALKICDPAMGSGAFLLQVCRRLGSRLAEAWEIERKQRPAVDFPDEFDKEAELSVAMRLVAEQCLYGVDVDPVAVKLAKISVRLLVSTKNEMFEISDEKFRVGDALLENHPADTFPQTASSRNMSGKIAPRKPFRWAAEFPDVFDSHDGGLPGFDVVVGNPPFLGGRKMRGVFGDEYLVRLKSTWPHASLNADLCSFFFLRAATILKPGGTCCFLATDTLAQGDTAKTGLQYLTDRMNFTIRNARSSFSWPGSATVVASLVALHNGKWNGKKYLNGNEVARISAILDESDDWGTAKSLPENVEINFQGSVFAGKGFVLSHEEAKRFLGARKRNQEVLFPFLGGNDVSTRPDFAASRWAIDFRDLPLEYCEETWPELMERIRLTVKPLRDRARREAHRTFWWHHGDKRPALYARIRKNEFVFVLTRHTKHLALARVPTGQVFQESLCILDLPDWSSFAAIQSTIHYIWAKRGSSTLGEGLRYTPTDYFDTFPFLHLASDKLEEIGKTYYVRREKIMKSLGEGFTSLYNRFHRPDENDNRIRELRELHRHMDESVCDAYGWNDIVLKHEFHEVGYLPAGDRIRYTIVEEARLEILRRFSNLAKEKG